MLMLPPLVVLPGVNVCPDVHAVDEEFAVAEDWGAVAVLEKLEMAEAELGFIVMPEVLYNRHKKHSLNDSCFQFAFV